MPLTGYFDESETASGNGARYFAISGYVSDDAGWRLFNRKWSHALSCDGFRAHGLHWTDLASGWGDLCHLGGAAKTRLRERLQRKYIAIIKSSRIQGVYCTFNLDDFDVLLPVLRQGRAGDPYKLAYYHAFESVLNCVCKLLLRHRLLGTDEQVDFVFDRNQKTANRSREIFEGIKSDQHVSFWRNLGGCTFLARHETLPLQASDVLANEVQRHLGANSENIRWQFARLRDGDQAAPFPFTRDMFQLFGAKLEKRLAERSSGTTA